MKWFDWCSLNILQDLYFFSFLVVIFVEDFLYFRNYKGTFSERM